MRIIRLSQSKDREAWLDFRRGRISGTKVKIVKPLARGKDRTPMGFWQLLAEKIAIASDGEPDMDRGHRLEDEALTKTAEKYGLDMDLDPGVWVSDENEDIIFSPDGCEKSDRPTWVAEAKCLSSANHLKYVIKDMRARKQDDYNPIDSVPNDAKSSYREQAIDGFVVNENLETLYFTLYDDRIALDKYMHHVIVIKRSDILEEIEAQRQMQVETLIEVNKLIAELTEES